MNSRAKFILMGLFISALVSFAGVSCMQYMQKQNEKYINMDEVELVQLEQPKDGDTIAVIKTDLGDIKAVLYPQYAPNAVEKFIELADSGYYDDTYVFQSEPGVYFGAGCPNKNGQLDEDHDPDNENIVQEISPNLWPIRGALCSISTGKEGGFFQQVFGHSENLNGSRFAVLNTVEITDDIKKELLGEDENGSSAESDNRVGKMFVEKGGLPNKSQTITVFGQTYEGFDVIDKLTDLEVNVDKDDEGIKTPVEDIKIKTVEISKYSSKDNSTAK